MKIVSRVKRVAGMALLVVISACAPKEKASDTQASASPVVAASPGPYPWKVPTELPAGQAGEQIRYGEQLITQTALHLGPDVSDPSLRISGNHMACKSCHLDAGKRAHALGFVGVASRYPAYRQG